MCDAFAFVVVPPSRLCVLVSQPPRRDEEVQKPKKMKSFLDENEEKLHRCDNMCRVCKAAISLNIYFNPMRIIGFRVAHVLYNTVDGLLPVVCNHLFVIKTAQKLLEPFSSNR